MEDARSRLSTRALEFIVTGSLWLTVVGVAIGIPAAVATTLTSDHPMSIHATVPVSTLGDGAEDLDVAGRASVSIPIGELTTNQIVVYHAAIAIAGAALIYSLWQLRQLVRSIRVGDAFSSANVRRLRVLGAVMLFGYPLFQYVAGTLQEWILSTGGPTGSSARVEIAPWSIVAVFGGLSLLVLAEVFAHGTALREDVEATV